ncbi:unnamed protein product [Chrysoparadoxa australica]
MIHPYGVKCLGDQLVSQESNPSCRPSLGLINFLDDNQVLALLSFLDAPALCRLSSTCRAAYVFSSVEEIWKDLVLAELTARPRTLKHIHRTWKATLQQLLCPSSSSPAPAQPIKVPGFYSDLLFQSHYCTHSPLMDHWTSNDMIERVDGSSMSLQTFQDRYESTNRPVVLTGIVTQWPAFKKWSRQHLLDQYGTSAFHGGGLDFTLKSYLKYADSTCDELPMTIFDKAFAERCPSLGSDYTVPPMFQDDLFQVLGKDRPDYRWFIAGPPRSGLEELSISCLHSFNQSINHPHILSSSATLSSKFHVDPNNTNAWNALIRGRKRWLMLPPGTPPPGIHPSPDGLDIAAPVSIMEWFINFYDEFKATPGMIEFTASEGELVFIPQGWWHLVLNLDWTVAITQNYVSRVNLPVVVNFLLDNKDTPEHVSGLPMAKRRTVGDQFVTALQAQRPDLAPVSNHC